MTLYVPKPTPPVWDIRQFRTTGDEPTADAIIEWTGATEVTIPEWGMQNGEEVQTGSHQGLRIPNPDDTYAPGELVDGCYVGTQLYNRSDLNYHEFAIFPDKAAVDAQFNLLSVAE